MSDMPTRIWVFDSNYLDPPTVHYEDIGVGTEYIHIDKYNDLEQQIKRQDLYRWMTEKNALIKKLEAQLNLDGTTDSQRCDRCHLANFFNNDKFKCWNCGLEHTED